MADLFTEHPEWRLTMMALVGSHAYGLNTPESDKDYLGIYQVPTKDVLGLHGFDETVTHSGPDYEQDVTLHELGKFFKLASKCNPTVLELLYLPEENYVALSEEANALIKYRHLFLSEQYVRDAFGGYALAQAKRLERRNAEGKDGFSSDTQKRTAKHARHCFRLLNQGAQLLATGDMTVRVANPDDLRALGELPVERIVSTFEKAFEKFNAIESVLPEKADIDKLSWLLTAMRLRPLQLDVADLQERLQNATDLITTLYRATGGSKFSAGPDTIAGVFKGEPDEQA